MHHIQRKILNLLLHAPSLSYAQMRPKGVESNHFAYHLDQLVRAGLVAKQDRQYTLTTEGLALVDRVSHESMTIRQQPHIVTTIQIINETGKVAVLRHAYQPYLDKYGFPQGRIHYEETIQESAIRELKEKTGLEDVTLTHRGMVYIHATRDGVDISKILSHVFTGEVHGEPEIRPEDAQKGIGLWKKPDTLKNCMPGFKEIRKLLSMHTDEHLFFSEIETSM